MEIDHSEGSSKSPTPTPTPATTLPAPLSETVPFDVAVDALSSDYLDRLAVLNRALNGDETDSDQDLIRLHDDAMARRYFLGLFDQRLKVDDGESTGKGKGKGKAELNLMSLPQLLELDEGEMKTWQGWRPQDDDVVLVYVSEGRGYWPGKIIPLTYFGPNAVPDVPRRQLFAIRLYPTKQAPIIALKSHMVPLQLRPDPPKQASSALAKGYRIARSSLVYDIEALGIEAENHQAWGIDVRKSAVSGQSWESWRSWIEDQAAQEKEGQGQIGIEGEARRILLELERRGYPIFPGSGTAATGADTNGLSTPMAIDSDVSTSSSTRHTASNADIKRARKRLTEALEDPIIGPQLNQLNLSEVCRSLVQPLALRNRQRSVPEGLMMTHFRTKSQLAETGMGAVSSGEETDGGFKRKRRESDEGMNGSGGGSGFPWKQDFVSPISGVPLNTSDVRDDEDRMEEDGKDSWHLVTPRKARKLDEMDDGDMRADPDARPGPQEWLSDRVIKQYQRKKRRV